MIITHGERTTQHELGERALVIGRDPGCDIFFIDQKLSRRHARIEPGAGGVQLIDLGSRNGTWVNELQVEQHRLTPGDQVRVGGLRIAYEEDPPPAPPTQSTMVLESPFGADEGTVALRSLEATGVAPDSTLLLGEAESTPAGTIPFKGSAARESGARTYVPSSPEALDRTRIAPALAATDVISVDRIEAPVDDAPKDAHSALDAVRQRVSALSWQTRLGLGLAAIGALAFLVASLPLANRLRGSIETESMERGKTLLRFLAAINEPILANKDFQDLNTDIIMGEPGVKDALVLDVDGKVLAPPLRSTEAHETLPGIDQKISEIHSSASGLTPAGDVNFIQPLVAKGKRIGFAVLTYAPSRSGGSLAEAIFVGFLVIAAGAYGAMLLTKNLTLRPIATIRDDVDAVIRGDAPFVDPNRPLPELSDLAESINKLHDAALRREGTGIPAALAETASQDAFPLAARRAASSDLVPDTETVMAAAPLAPSAPPALDSEIVIDENFVVARAHPSALAILDSTAQEVEGKHLIEAIREQKLLELVLDLVNGLASHPSTEGQCELDDAGAVSARAERRGGAIVVALAKQ